MTFSDATEATDATGTPAEWERLCSLLEPDPEIADSVRAALADADRAAPWAALVDSLDESGALACLDTADTGDLLVDALTALPRLVRARLADPAGLDLRAVTDVDDLGEAVAAARRALSAVGLDLLALEEGDGDEECLPLVAVARDDVAEITALVGALGQRLLPLD